MKLKRIIVFGIIGCLIFFYGCVAQLGANLIGEAIGNSMDGKKIQKPNEVYDLIEKHEIGTNTVAIHTAITQYNPGYIFIVFDRNKKMVSNLFFYAAKEDDMKKYNAFLSMNTEEKRIYIYETFKKFGLDLGPIESDAQVLLASYTPAIGDTFAKVVKNLGDPNDEFLLKDEKGEPVPNTNMIWYFEVQNNQLTRVLSMYVRDGIVSKVEERTNDKPPYTIGFYKSYLYLCATMAYRAPRFAFALNESSPIN